MRSDLVLIRSGAFSGSALSLRDKLDDFFNVRDVDVQGLTQVPHHLLGRTLAHCSARLRRPPATWTRTKVWAEAVQSALAKVDALPSDVPILCVQSSLALAMRPDSRYFIYTDRVAVEGASGDPRFSPVSTAAWMRREAEFLRAARTVFVMGPDSESTLLDVYGLPPSRVEVVATGINVDVRSTRQRLECKRILFVGTQWELKGGPDLLEAFLRLSERFVGLELEIVGCSPQLPSRDGVIVTGPVDSVDMPELLERADVLVLPSRFEAGGTVLAEALLEGMPVIGTTAGYQWWIIGQGGHIVEPGRPDQLEQALSAVITDYGTHLRRALDRQAEMQLLFSWEAVAMKIAHRIYGG